MRIPALWVQWSKKEGNTYEHYKEEESCAISALGHLGRRCDWEKMDLAQSVHWYS